MKNRHDAIMHGVHSGAFTRQDISRAAYMAMIRFLEPSNQYEAFTAWEIYCQEIADTLEDNRIMGSADHEAMAALVGYDGVVY